MQDPRDEGMRHMVYSTNRLHRLEATHLSQRKPTPFPTQCPHPTNNNHTVCTTNNPIYILISFLVPLNIINSSTISCNKARVTDARDFQPSGTPVQWRIGEREGGVRNWPPNPTDFLRMKGLLIVVQICHARSRFTSNRLTG